MTEQQIADARTQARNLIAKHCEMSRALANEAVKRLSDDACVSLSREVENVSELVKAMVRGVAAPNEAERKHMETQRHEQPQTESVFSGEPRRAQLATNTEYADDGFGGE